VSLRDEFEKLFVHKGESCDDPPDKWAWTIRGSFPIEVWSWLEQKFAEAQAETVERLANWLYAELKARTWHDKDDATAEVIAQKLRARSPDSHARERWELEARTSQHIHDCNFFNPCHWYAGRIMTRGCSTGEGLERQLATLLEEAE